MTNKPKPYNVNQLGIIDYDKTKKVFALGGINLENLEIIKKHLDFQNMYRSTLLPSYEHPHEDKWLDKKLEATVKRFFKEDGYYRLQPENDTMEPIIVDECTVLGKVFGVFRFF